MNDIKITLTYVIGFNENVSLLINGKIKQKELLLKLFVYYLIAQSTRVFKIQFIDPESNKCHCLKHVIEIQYIINMYA